MFRMEQHLVWVKGKFSIDFSWFRFQIEKYFLEFEILEKKKKRKKKVQEAYECEYLYCLNTSEFKIDMLGCEEEG